MSSHDASQDKWNYRIRRVDIATGATTTLAGSGNQGFLDGVGGSAKFNNPDGIAIDPSGTFALVGVRRPPPYPRIPPSCRRHTRLAHTRRRGRTGFHTTLCGQTFGLALPQCVLP